MHSIIHILYLRLITMLQMNYTKLYMKYDLLKLLAKDILFQSHSAISKVRFAKMIYFAYKHLVKLNIYSSEDLAFIRMPLGPVPVGFMDLSTSSDFLVKTSALGLMYNRESYELKDREKYLCAIDEKILNEFVLKLHSFSTSKLVELSHEDYSWKNHSNGQEYFLTKKDLETTLPRTSILVNEDIDNQLIQARLVHGMEDDAVVDSTNLEYPENNV